MNTTLQDDKRNIGGLVSTTGFLGAVGNTPLVRLNRLSEETGCEIYAKTEFSNPGGSIKDRPAKWMIESAEEKGQIKPGGTVIEGTAGNTGVGLAHICRSKGYNLIVYMPDTLSQAKMDNLRLLGATVYAVPVVPFSDPMYFNHQAERHAESLDNALFTNQFSNMANTQSHYESTGPEIWNQLEGKFDYFTCAAGTGGTIGGISRYLKEQSQDRIKCYLADPPGSALHSYVKSRDLTPSGGDSSFAEGIGQKVITGNMDAATKYLDDSLEIPDEDTIHMIYRLWDEEGLYVGTSSGVNVCAAKKLAEINGPGKTIVTVLCDKADRYVQRLFSKSWLESMDLLQYIPPHMQKYIALD